MEKMTLKNFFERIYAPNVKNGRKFWSDGGVIYTTKESADEYEALVMGSGANYHVNIEFDGDEIVETSCTCNNDWAEYCKHVMKRQLSKQDRLRLRKRPLSKKCPFLNE